MDFIDFHGMNSRVLVLQFIDDIYAVLPLNLAMVMAKNDHHNLQFPVLPGSRQDYQERQLLDFEAPQNS